MWTTVRANSQRPATNPISGASSLMSFSTLLVENDPRPYMGFSQSLKAVSLDCVKPRLHQSWPVNQEGWRFLPSIWWRQSLQNLSTQEHDNTPTPEHEEDPRAPTVPPQKKRRLAKSQEDGYVDLVRKETERAEIQIALAKEQTTLAKEQITLTLLHQRETKLHIVLLEERLRNDAIAMSDEDNVT